MLHLASVDLTMQPTCHHPLVGIAALPNELLTEILSHIDSFNARLACRLVCRHWLACGDDRRAWNGHGYFDTLRVRIGQWSHGYSFTHEKSGTAEFDVTSPAGISDNWTQGRPHSASIAKHRRFLAFILARIPLRSFSVHISKYAPVASQADVDLWAAVMNALNVTSSQLTSIHVDSKQPNSAVVNRVEALIGRLRPNAATNHSIEVAVNGTGYVT